MIWNILLPLLGLSLVLTIVYFLGFIRGAPFVPTKPAKIREMVAAAEIKPGDRLADLGSGDGRILIAAARAGAQAHGFEINPILVWWSRRNIRRANLENKAFVHWRNFWLQDFSGFNIVTIYGFKGIMVRLEQKLQHELPAEARVICNVFPFPHWPLAGKGKVYKYLK